MPVKRDDDGKRSVQVETEVVGTPEEVWRAIATAQGITSWFVPTTSDAASDDGSPTKITSNFGPGMESVSSVTSWDPPYSFEAESQDFGPDGPTIATKWIVETKSGGVCVVRVVHSLFASTDDWDEQMEGWENGWPSFFRILRLYMKHFAGERGAQVQLTGFHAEPRDEAWRALFAALGTSCPDVGGRVASSDGAPPLRGVAEHVGDAAYPEELLLRLEEPAPGIAHLFAMEMEGQVLLSVRFYLYGLNVEDVVKRAEPTWQAWLASAFPAPEEASEA